MEDGNSQMEKAFEMANRKCAIKLDKLVKRLNNPDDEHFVLRINKVVNDLSLLVSGYGFQRIQSAPLYGFNLYY